MKNFGTCRFCDIVGGRCHYPGIDEPFAVNDEFVAVASIGALVEGWSLIIPKVHQLSMRNIYGRSPFANIMESVVPPLINLYGRLIAFEHGANKEGSITACGTDHAHLHIVPLGESLLSGLQDSGLEWIQCYASEIASMTGENEYLFYSELYDEKELWQDPAGYLHVLEYPVSQFFRRLIAERRGLSEVSDYKRFPHIGTASQTRRVLVSSVT